MQEMGNLDVFFLSRELASLEGARLDNAYQCGEKDFRFRFGKKDLVARLGEHAFLGERKPAPKSPSQFAMLLRKHLRGKRVSSVGQVGFDRLLRVGFGGKSLVFELFSNGNLLLLDGERIVRPFKFEEFSARTLKPGETYSPPPSAKEDPRTAEFPCKGKAVPALSKELELPPFYLEEACARAGVGFTEELDAEKAAAIREAALSLFSEARPVLYLGGGKPLAFSPFPLKKMGGKEFKEFDSFSAALEEYYSFVSPSGAAPEKDFVREQRLKAITDFAVKEREAREAGDWLSANAFPVDRALELVKQGKIGEARKKLGAKITREGRFLRFENEIGRASCRERVCHRV